MGLTLYHGRPDDETGRLPKEIRTYDCLDSLGIDYYRLDHPPADSDDPELLALSEYSYDVPAPRGGDIESLDAEKIGIASQHTGAGREKKDDDVDHGAGILLHAKTGDSVRQGEPLCTVYSSDEESLVRIGEEALSAFAFSDVKPAARPLIYKIIGDGEEE